MDKKSNMEMSRDELIDYILIQVDQAKQLGVDRIVAAIDGDIISGVAVADRVTYALDMQPWLNEKDEPLLWKIGDYAWEADQNVKNREAWEQLFILADELKKAEGKKSDMEISRAELVGHILNQVDQAKQLGVDRIVEGKEWDLYSGEAIAERVSYKLAMQPWLNKQDEPLLYRIWLCAGELNDNAKNREAWEQLFKLTDELRETERPQPK